MDKKKFNMFAIIMVMMQIVCFGSCSSDSDGSDGEVSYTSDEIVEILTGRWSIKGQINWENQSQTDAGEYTGSIEFSKSEKRNWVSYLDAPVTYEKSGEKSNLNKIIRSRRAGSDYEKYEVMRSNGKMYLCLPTSSGYWPFQIRSMNKNSFKLVLDEPLTSGGRLYVTMISE